MSAAQNLYEAGYITYLRTDAVTLSDDALTSIGVYINDTYGSKYYRRVQYKSKGKNTQEAHEAVRPTDVKNVDSLTGKRIGNDELKLYSLIWKRAVASQMTPAKIKQIQIHIDISNVKKYEFISKTEVVQFAGFLKVYNIEDVEKEQEPIETIKTMPNKNDILEVIEIVGKQGFQKPPSRYSEGTLTKKMNPENLNIGRPATTQSFITKIQERDYVKKGDIDGVEKDIITLKLNNKKILSSVIEKIMYGKETNKFYPTELGFKVNDFLMKYFPNIMNYQFTSDMEEKLDEIAEGKIKWLKVMKDFYKDFHPTVTQLILEAKTLVKMNKKILGKYPNTDENIEVTLAKFGPVVKMKRNKKYIYAPIRAPLTQDNITLADAIKLLEYPKSLGQYEGIDVLLQKGPYGFYIKYNGENVAVGENADIKLTEAIEAIKKRNSGYLWTGTDGVSSFKILNGKFGMYINITNIKTKKKRNVKLPKDTDVASLTLDKVKEIVSTWKPKRRFVKKTTKTD